MGPAWREPTLPLLLALRAVAGVRRSRGVSLRRRVTRDDDPRTDPPRTA